MSIPPTDNTGNKPIIDDAFVSSGPSVRTKEDQKAHNNLILTQDVTNQVNGIEIFAFLFAMFLGIQNEEGQSPFDTNHTDRISDALGIDKLAFRERVSAVRSGELGTFAAARQSYNEINHNTLDWDKAQKVVAKYANTDNPLLELIADKESGGDYNRIYGKGVQRANLTSMTINEVLAWQKHRVEVEGSPSSAAGKYQIISGTLKEEVGKLGLTGNELFDEAMQDRIALSLLEKRGYSDYLSGKIPEDTFMENIAKEWAAMPKDESGLSYYDGDGLNKAHVSPATLLLAMRHTKDNSTAPQSEMLAQFNDGGVPEKQSPGNLTPAHGAAMEQGGVVHVAAAETADEFKVASNEAQTGTPSLGGTKT